MSVSVCLSVCLSVHLRVSYKPHVQFKLHKMFRACYLWLTSCFDIMGHTAWQISKISNVFARTATLIDPLVIYNGSEWHRRGRSVLSMIVLFLIGKLSRIRWWLAGILGDGEADSEGLVGATGRVCKAITPLTRTWGPLKHGLGGPRPTRWVGHGPPKILWPTHNFRYF